MAIFETFSFANSINYIWMVALGLPIISLISFSDLHWLCKQIINSLSSTVVSLLSRPILPLICRQNSHNYTAKYSRPHWITTLPGSPPLDCTCTYCWLKLTTVSIVIVCYFLLFMYKLIFYSLIVLLRQRKLCVFNFIECNLKVYIFVFVHSEEIIKLFISICNIFKCINTFYTNCIYTMFRL